MNDVCRLPVTIAVSGWIVPLNKGQSDDGLHSLASAASLIDEKLYFWASGRRCFTLAKYIRFDGRLKS
jgi:hypothetical protein